MVGNGCAMNLPDDKAEPTAGQDAWLYSLQANGYKLTAARRALIDLMARSQQALSVVQILALLETQEPQFGRATVYRTLEILEELGLLQRVHDEHGCHRYRAAIQTGPAIICETCGRQAQLDDTILQAVLRLVERQCQYQIQDYWLQFTGTCADCRSSMSLAV